MIDAATVFAWFVMAILLGISVAAIVFIGSLPKRIAVKRNHPQADAINATSVGSDGQFVISFRLDDSELERQLSMGTAGTVVVYTKRGKPLHVISKALVRVNAWKYYLMPF